LASSSSTSSTNSASSSAPSSSKAPGARRPRHDRDPLPRTLAQTAYGDLNVTTLDELPPGRGKIITGIRSAKKLPEAVKFLREQIEGGRQIYLVYPLVEESDKLPAKAATAEFERWQPLLAPHACGLLHGRLKPEEKESVMTAFRSGETKALISTTVIEVGVDVPNATVMLIENAERFGLAQLHQLRGRIGRGKHTSYCILVPGKDTEEAREKLGILEETTDGFRVAEADLQLRGHGDLIGTAQTGLPPLRLGDILRDHDQMLGARTLAQKIFTEDPDLDHPAHANLKAWLATQPSNLTALAG
jgi:ATP-dependent DNA helicase RecG